MNQHQTHRLCARIHTAIELPLAAALLKQQLPQSAVSLDEVKLIKLRVHLESAVRLVREQVGVRSLGVSATAAKEAGLSSYVNNEKENIEDEMKDRVLLAQLVEATKGTSSFIFILI